jgi:hypothetical protein
MHPEFPAGSEVVIAIPHPKFSDVVEGLPIFYTNDIVSRAISPSDLPRLQGTQDTYVFIYEQGELHEWHRSRRH